MPGKDRPADLVAALDSAAATGNWELDERLDQGCRRRDHRRRRLPQPAPRLQLWTLSSHFRRWTDPWRLYLLAHHITAIDRDRLAGDIACSIAAQKENGVRDLLGPTFALHGYEVLDHRPQRIPLSFRLHLVAHRRANESRTDVIHANAARRVLESRAFGKADDAVLRGVIRAALIATDQTAKRRAVHDGTAALFAHHAELELHTAPDTPQVDAHDPVIVFARRVGRFCEHVLNTRVVVSNIQPPQTQPRSSSPWLPPEHRPTRHR